MPTRASTEPTKSKRFLTSPFTRKFAETIAIPAGVVIAAVQEADRTSNTTTASSRPQARARANAAPPKITNATAACPQCEHVVPGWELPQGPPVEL